MVERQPKTIRIDRLELIKYAPPDVEVEVDCSPGTYVRVLASDLGHRLGCGGYLASLRRTGHHTLAATFVMKTFLYNQPEDDES